MEQAFKHVDLMLKIIQQLLFFLFRALFDESFESNEDVVVILYKIDFAVFAVAYHFYFSVPSDHRY